MNNPSKRSPRPFVSMPYSGDKPAPSCRPLGTAGENEKTPADSHEPAGAKPLPSEQRREEDASDARLWALQKLDFVLTNAIAMRVRELQLMLDELRSRRGRK